MYALPYGGIILGREKNEYFACVGLRRFDSDTAELKRMFVQPAYQQKGIGKLLMVRSIELAKQCGYSMIRLDTLSYMTTAITLYKKYGFSETTPYYHNPNPTAVFFELLI